MTTCTKRAPIGGVLLWETGWGAQLAQASETARHWRGHLLPRHRVGQAWRSCYPASA